MFNFMFQRESVPVLESALSFANQKHSTIMNNIANVNTPYYKRQAVPEGEFRSALTEAINARDESHPSRFFMNDTRRIAFDRAGMIPDAEVFHGREFGPERHDENSVVIEKEMADLAENALRIETLQRLLKKKYSMLRASLRERVA